MRTLIHFGNIYIVKKKVSNKMKISPRTSNATSIKFLTLMLFIFLIFTGCNAKETTEESHSVNDAASNESSDSTAESDESPESPTESDDTDDEKPKVYPEVDISNYKIIEDQSFDVKLNDWGNVRFVSMGCRDSALYDPLFMLYKDNTPIYQFPILSEDNNCCGGLEDVYLVAFKDIDEDGKDEVITGFHYVTGAGPDGMTPRCDIRIYKDKGDHFEYLDELCEFIFDNTDVAETTIEYLYDLIPKYTLSKMDMASMYNNKKPADNAANFEGKWNSTSCHSSETGTFTIKDQTKDGFSFEGNLKYYSQEDRISGSAMFVSNNVAICNNNGYIAFYMCDDKLYIKYDDYWNNLKKTYDDPNDFFDDVEPNYIYTKATPSYTNSNIINEAFDQKELDKIKEVIGSDLYENNFINNTKNGYVHYTSSDKMNDGTICKHIECLSKTTGELYDLLLAPKKRVFIKFYDKKEGSFFTNDPDWKGNNLPETEWDPFIQHDDLYDFENPIR